MTCLSESDHEFLLQARVRLALNHPFLATAITRLPFKDASEFSWCNTMATDGYHIYYNAGWAQALPKKELEAVITHEVLHVVFGHSDRINGRNKNIWNAACDYAINIMLFDLGFDLPCDGLLDQRFRRLTAEQIYRELITESTSSTGKITISSLLAVGGELAGDVLGSEEITATPIQDADAPDEQGRRMLRRDLSIEMVDRLKEMGSKAGQFQIEITAAVKNRADWNVILRRFLHEKVKTDWSMYPPSKKYIWQQIYLPSVGVSSIGTIVFAIDTSGSMSEEELSKSLAEVRMIRASFPCELIIIQCDASIQQVTTYSEFDDTPVSSSIGLKGRGGTDFKPVFQWIDDNHLHPGVLIYATDGYGTFPKQAPAYATIWLMTDRGSHAFDPPFGFSIDISN